MNETSFYYLNSTLYVCMLLLHVEFRFLHNSIHNYKCFLCCGQNIFSAMCSGKYHMKSSTYKQIITLCFVNFYVGTQSTK